MIRKMNVSETPWMGKGGDTAGKVEEHWPIVLTGQHREEETTMSHVAKRL